MHILAVADFYRHGAARVVEDRAGLLVRRGHRVVLIAGTEQDRVEAEQTAARREGIDPELIPYLPEDRGLKSLLALQRAYRGAFEKRAAMESFDAVLFNQPLSAWAVLRSPLSRGLATLYTFHSPWAVEWAIGCGLEPRPGALGGLRNRAEFAARRWIEKQALTRSDGITLLSQFMDSQLSSLHRGIPSRKIHRIPGGVDLDRFRPLNMQARRARKAALGLPPDAPLLLTVRRLVSRMGIENLLKAFRKLSPEFPGLHLAIGGSGPLAGSLRTLAGELGISRLVHFLGYVPEDDLPGLYGAADLFVLPTTQLEGFGLVTVEALASGTLVVGTRVGATPEILGPIDQNLLARDASPEGLRRAIRHILCLTPHERLALEDRAGRHMRTLYGTERVGEALDALLARLVHHRGGWPGAKKNGRRRGGWKTVRKVPTAIE